MERKYELTNETIEIGGKTLHRIKAVRDFANIKAGDLGGFIEKEGNLSHNGNAWVYDNAKVCDNARVYGNAKVYDVARVYGNADVYGNTDVCGDALVYGDADVCGNALIKSCFDLCVFMYFGSTNRTTTAFKTRDKNICVKCGCFSGTLEEFRNKVKETHGDNQYAKEYLMIADLIELKLKH